MPETTGFGLTEWRALDRISTKRLYFTFARVWNARQRESEMQDRAVPFWEGIHAGIKQQALALSIGCPAPTIYNPASRHLTSSS